MTAAIIYHPKYGDGERREDGKLYVRLNPDFVNEDKVFARMDDRDNKRPISESFFRSWKYGGGPTGKDNPVGAENSSSLKSSPATFFARLCPNMVKEGLIYPHKDFGIAFKKESLGMQLRAIQKNGSVLLNGRYIILGRAFAEKNIYQISETLGVILDGSEENGLQVVKVFTIPSDPIPEEELQRKAASRRAVKKENITFYDPDQVEGLAAEDGLLVTNFEDFLAFSNRVGREAEFNLLTLTLKEKALATAIYQHYKDDPRLWGFIKRYGLDGLRSMMAVEEAKANVDAILEISEKMPADGIFADVSQVVRTVTQYQDTIREQLSEEEQREADEVARTVLSFMSKVQLALLPIVRNEPSLKGNFDLTHVSTTLHSFQKMVTKMYETKFGIKISDERYQRMLSVYHGEANNPNVDQVALQILSQIWKEQASAQEQASMERVNEAITFYNGNQELLDTASQTTGDTKQEIAHFQEYLPEFLKRRIDRELNRPDGDPDFRVLDMGCGDAQRMTVPMAEAVKSHHGKVIGVDLVHWDRWNEGGLPDNLKLVQGSFTDLREPDGTKMPDRSIALATANWSVLNDLTTIDLQLKTMRELSRVMEKGGEVYFDVPQLEGKGKSWKKAADEYHRLHPEQPYGMIHARFPTGKSNDFYLYSKEELAALLDQVGFTVTEIREWQTQNDMPRTTFIAVKDRNYTPQMVAAA